MKVKAVRLYGKKDLRFEEFELRDISPDEVLARIITDSLCMSSYKALLQGSDHRCVPPDIDKNPIIMGHEFCGVIEKIGERVTGLQTGDVFTVQPKMVFGNVIKGPGYSYREYGGDTTHAIIPAEVPEGGYLLPYKGDGYYKASLTEPLSCLISAVRAQYHLGLDGKTHVMGLRKGGCMAILAGAGPMGLGAVQVAMSAGPQPRRIVITDIDSFRLDRAKQLLRPAAGVELLFVNTASMERPEEYLRAQTDGKGFDDILVMAPVTEVIELADKIAGIDSCINFFAGPTSKDFRAPINFYDVHYNDKHIIGTSGGSIGDMRESLDLIESGSLEPAVLISHIGGLNSAAAATLDLPKIPGAKKLIYCNLEMDLTAIDDFEKKGETDPLFRELHTICAKNGMLWCPEAEKYLLGYRKPV
jgi:threonine dehydrogenase-like Zn-dependent dehydrogenase